MLLDEGKDVALLSTDEAGIAAASRDGKIGVRAVMERTRAAKAVARALERHVLADDRDDVRAFAQALDVLVGDHPRSTTVTPAPPSFQAPSRNPFTRVSLRSISFTSSRSAPVPLP